MTDNEIIKALEEFLYTLEDGYTNAIEFGGKRDEQIEKEIYLLRDALSLINRQKAEIERLNAMIDAAEDHFAPLPFKNSFDEYIEKAKAEAIKEFAERLSGEIEQALESNYKAKAERMAKPNIEMADDFISYCEGKISALRGIGDFSENLAKEMVGDG